MENLDFYLKTSEFTDLGKYKQEAIDLWENKCGRDLKNLCHLLMNVVVHRVIIQMALKGEDVKNYGDFSFIDFRTPMCEDDKFLTASAMFNEIFRRDSKGFYIGRPAENRLILTCRYVSVLTSAILKANGIPCRCRAGWAKYLRETDVVDHWVNEYYDKKQKRFVMIDMDDLYDINFLGFELYKKNGITYQYLDIPKEQFYTASDAWLNFRKDKNFINNFTEGSFKVTANNIIKYLFLDFYALNNFELNYTFKPLAYNKPFNELTNEELHELDCLAMLLKNPDENFEKLNRLYNANSKLRMIESPLVGKNNYELLVKKQNASNSCDINIFEK